MPALEFGVDRTRQVFLLSPANCSGKRAALLMRREAEFDLAQRLRSDAGAPIGEVFSFMSGLYFRGKLAYAGAFACAPEGCAGVQVIVPGRGLLPADHLIGPAELRAMAKIPVDADERRYTGPLARDAAKLELRLGGGDAVILLGSIATPKYLQPLSATLGRRLRFPAEFVGRGDMSRGSLMLRHAAQRRELTYVPACGFI